MLITSHRKRYSKLTRFWISQHSWYIIFKLLYDLKCDALIRDCSCKMGFLTSRRWNQRFQRRSHQKRLAWGECGLIRFYVFGISCCSSIADTCTDLYERHCKINISYKNSIVYILLKQAMFRVFKKFVFI